MSEKARSKFIEAINSIMEWNGANVTYDNESNTFEYTCYPGQSVLKELREAFKTIGLKCTCGWMMEPEERTEAADWSEHYYWIRVKGNLNKWYEENKNKTFESQ